MYILYHKRFTCASFCKTSCAVLTQNIFTIIDPTVFVFEKSGKKVDIYVEKVYN